MLKIGDLRRAIADMPADADVLLRVDMAVPLTNACISNVLMDADGQHEAYVDGWYDVAEVKDLSENEFALVVGNEV